MPTRLITPPAALAVSLEEAKANLRIDNNDQDAIVTTWVKGLTKIAEDHSKRSFINQTWRITLDSFPSAIVLGSPVSSVLSVKYLDSDGIERTLDPADYFVDAASEPGYVVPGGGKSWPETYDRINSVTVDYVLGCGEDSTFTPEAARLYILAELREQFDPMAKPGAASSFIDRILDGLVVY